MSLPSLYAALLSAAGAMKTPPLVLASLAQHALRLLADRPHARGELRDKLTRLCLRRKLMSKRPAVRALYADVCPDAAVDEVLAQFDAQLLDDVVAAEWHVAQREAYRPRSALQLRAELARKRVSSEVAASVIARSEHNELAAALRLARKKPRLSDDKLTAHLLRKGFSLGVAGAAVKARASTWLPTGKGGGAGGDDEVEGNDEEEDVADELDCLEDEEEEEDQEQEDSAGQPTSSKPLQ